MEATALETFHIHRPLQSDHVPSRQSTNRTAGGLNQPRATISFLPSPSLPSDPWRATEARQIPAASSRQNAASSSHYRIPYTNLTGRGLIFFLPFCRHLTKLLSLSLIKPVFSHFKALGISFGGVPPPPPHSKIRISFLWNKISMFFPHISMRALSSQAPYPSNGAAHSEQTQHKRGSVSA